MSVSIQPAWRCAVSLACLGLLAAPRAAPGAGDEAPGSRAQLAIWCEFMPYDEVSVHLPALARHNCDLILHVEDRDIGSPALATLLRRADAAGVRVLAWFLLPYDAHLYLSEESIGPMRTLALEFLDWAASEGLAVHGAALDCEPSPLLGRELSRAVEQSSPRELARVLRRQKDPARFSASVQAVADLVEELRSRGLFVTGAGNRVLLDSATHGNLALQDSLNSPFTMIDWDATSFITYRYRIAQRQYVAMIRRYGARAVARYGPRASLDIGLLGSHRAIDGHLERARAFGMAEFYLSFLDGMDDPGDLAQAVGAGLGVGLRRIGLFSLEGAAASPQGLEAWLAAAAGADPARGLAVWTPWQSLKLGLSAATLNGLFRLMVGREQYALPPARPGRAPASSANQAAQAAFPSGAARAAD